MKVFSWVRQFVEWHKDLSDNRQFMDSIKLDLFPRRGVCLYPKR